MVSERPIFKLLRESDNPATDDALLTALKGADPCTAQAIVDTLLERHTSPGLHGLIAIFHELEDPVRHRIVVAAEHLFRALREASQSRHEQVRLNVIEAIRRGALYRASYLLDAALHDPASQVRQTAAETIYHLTETLLENAARSAELDVETLTPEQVREHMIGLDVRAEDRRQLAAAIASGLTCFNIHHQPRIVEAAMWLADDLGRRLWTAISAPGGKVLRVAITVFDGSKDTRLIPFAIAGMNHSEFRPHVVKMLSACNDPAYMAEWFRACWRMTEPKTARSMSTLRELAVIEQHANGILQLPPDAQRHVARWLAATGTSAETKIGLMQQLYRRGDQSSQSTAVWSLVTMRDERALACLQTVAADGHAEHSRVALYELARRRPDQYPPGDLLSQKSDGSPRPTRAEPQSMTFDNYWMAFDGLNDEQRVRLGQDVLAITPSLARNLQRLLEDPDTTNRLRALRMAQTLNALEACAEQLYTMSHDPLPAIRSAAVLALGQLDNSTSRLILHNALLDPDSRVQANAVEAVDRLEGSFDPKVLLGKLDSSDNRVRANAVRALLKMGVREAAEALLKMLQAENRAERISALWLIDQMGLFTLATRVCALAGEDADAQVRARARLLMNRLTSESREPAGGAVSALAARSKPEVTSSKD